MNRSHSRLKAVLVFAAMSAALGSPIVCRTQTQDVLAAGFKDPPPEARPRVWWHWMDGNITETGIRADLEWMHRIGLGGVQVFDAAFPAPARVQPRVTYMTPQWQRALRLSVETAEKLALEFSVAGAPGWSESGGPWVQPEQAMKKVVWSELRIEGGRRFTGSVPRPPATIGPFQDVPVDREGVFNRAPKVPPRELYEDIAVLAYRLPRGAQSNADSKPRITSSAGPLDGTAFSDGNLKDAIAIPYESSGQPAWIQLTFDAPQTIRAISLGLKGRAASPAAELQSSLDNRTFETVVSVPEAGAHFTLAFPAVTARYFRLKLPVPPPPAASMLDSFMKQEPQSAHLITELVLHHEPRVHRAEAKAAFVIAQSLEGSATPTDTSSSAIRRSDIVDLTKLLKENGTLDWRPPAGDWVILRFGYSLLGVTNHPASAEATGLEVDKLNRAHVQSNYQQYLDRFTELLGSELIGARGLRGMVNDSWEAGAQNWTETMPAEFSRRRGYSLVKWLPALAGRVIGSAEETDGFLWDFRKTLGELVAEAHYRTIAEEVHRRGMVHYAESHESFRAFIGDGMATKQFADVPMSAMWAGGDWQPHHGDADMRESASVAHLHGQNLVAAEMFTASDDFYSYVPEMLKPVADRAFAQGLNRSVIHTSVHQPFDEPGPGFTLGPFGQWFTRHETWAEQAKPWVDYLARSSYLLQQGHAVSDLLYFYGEDTNLAAKFGRYGANQLPVIPAGFAYDFVNEEALSLLSVQDGQMVTDSGMRYSALIVDPGVRVLSLPVLRQMHRLLLAGATLIGSKPVGTPSLSDDSEAFQTMVDEIWGRDDSASERQVGTGRILQSLRLADAVGRLRMGPDFAYQKVAADSQVEFVHRRLAEGDLYFVTNRQGRAEQFEASFRVTGKAPELWHADTGHIERASYRFVDNRTVIPLSMDAHGAVFVVFREETSQSARTIPQPERHSLSLIENNWKVRFPAGQGLPPVVHFDSLISWSDHAEPAIKYFSGTASYERRVVIPASRQGARVELDLGVVKDLAEVFVNGRSLGVLWKAPFRVDITEHLRPGANQLEVRVTNTWVNRLIGDQQPGAKAHAYASFDPYKADSPLLPSGLLGPVRLTQVIQLAPVDPQSSVPCASSPSKGCIRALGSDLAGSQRSPSFRSQGAFSPTNR